MGKITLLVDENFAKKCVAINTGKKESEVDLAKDVDLIVESIDFTLKNSEYAGDIYDLEDYATIFNATKEKSRSAIDKIQYRIDTASKIAGRGADGKALEDLEYAIAAITELEHIKNNNSIELPCPIGSTVYEIYQFCGKGAWEIDHHKICLEDLDKIGKTVFLTIKAANEAIAKKENED